jgi:hypothetical protein
MNQEQPTLEQVLNTTKMSLGLMGIECRLKSGDPYEVEGQVFQSTAFEIKDKDGNWVVMKSTTSAIDPTVHIKQVEEAVEKEEKALADAEKKLKARKDAFETTKLEVISTKTKLSEFIVDMPKEQVAPVEEK